MKTVPICTALPVADLADFAAAVECPKCHAAVGAPCMRRGKREPLPHPHAARVGTAADRAIEQFMESIE